LIVSFVAMSNRSDFVPIERADAALSTVIPMPRTPAKALRVASQRDSASNYRQILCCFLSILIGTHSGRPGA
jgi:hypothetical protein